MKKILTIQALLLVATLLSGCGVTWSSVAYNDDLYEVHDKDKIADSKLRAMSKREAAQSQYDSRLSQSNTFADSFESVLADDYESAYARRLYGFSSPTYRMPSSYYTYRYSDAFFYASAYDPAIYNVMVSGDMIWVEPKYVTSMFGTWGASVVPAYSWYYGWGNPYAGTWWGSPYRYYPWNNYWYSGIYNPYLYWSYWGYWGYPYHHYYPHHHHHYYPPHHGGVGNTGYNPGRGRVYRNTSAPAPAVRGGSSYRGGTTTYTPSSGSSYRSSGSSGSSYRSSGNSSSSRSEGGSTYRSSGSRGTSTYRSTTPSYSSGGGGGSSYRGGSTHGR